MFGHQIALSTDDFSSGRFQQLANFIQLNWPFTPRPSDKDVLNILAQSLGYEGYAEALGQASEKALSRAIGGYAVVNNFEKLEFGSQKSMNHKELIHSALESLMGRISPTTEFVQTWPLALVNRWNYKGDGCSLSAEFIKNAESDFAALWSNTLRNHNGFATESVNSTTAAVMISKMEPRLTGDQIRSGLIGDVLDAEVADAIVMDIMPLMLDEMLQVNQDEADALVAASGMSMTDLWELPRNESGFPNLYAHMKAFVRTELLTRKMSALYLLERNESGFFHEPLVLEGKGCKTTPIGDYSFVFTAKNDEIDSDEFKSYTWHGQLKSASGKVLCCASGSLFTGAADQDNPGFELISAADETNDLDVEIIDMVLNVLQDLIYEKTDDEVDKGNVNTLLLFKFGNLMTLHHWERSSEASPGAGMRLLNLCINALITKFKRKVHLATLVDPFAYNDDALSMPSLVEERGQEIQRISKKLMSLNTSTGIVGIYIHEKYLREGPSIFSEYCLEQDEDGDD